MPIIHVCISSMYYCCIIIGFLLWLFGMFCLMRNALDWLNSCFWLLTNCLRTLASNNWCVSWRRLWSRDAQTYTFNCFNDLAQLIEGFLFYEYFMSMMSISSSQFDIYLQICKEHCWFCEETSIPGFCVLSRLISLFNFHTEHGWSSYFWTLKVLRSYELTLKCITLLTNSLVALMRAPTRHHQSLMFWLQPQIIIF